MPRPTFSLYATLLAEDLGKSNGGVRCSSQGSLPAPYWPTILLLVLGFPLARPMCCWALAI